jgi:phosphoglycolate phosphatase
MARMGTRHVIWDWNGTLLDDAWLCMEILNGMLARRGLPQTDLARYRETFSFPVVNVYRAMGFDMGGDAFEKMSVEYMDEYQARRHECALQPGAEEALAALRQAGLSQSILSAYRQDMLEAVVKERGLCNYFGHLAGNTNIFAASKADYGKTLLKKIGLEKEEVLLVGDTAHDFEVARELGVGCILVSCGHYSAERLRSLGAPVFADLFQAGRQLSREALPSPTGNEQALPA